MKLTKLFTAFAVMAFLITGCSSDDNNDPIRPGVEQVEIGTKSPYSGKYVYAHAGHPFPIFFNENTITIAMSQMTGIENAETGDADYDIIKVYKNDKEVTKIVAKNSKEYATFFFKNATDDSVEINLDYTFETEKEAIDAAYPSETEKARNSIRVDNPHGNMKFGWLKLTKIQDLERISGTYETKIVQNNMAQFQFTIGVKDGEEFAMLLDMTGNGVAPYAVLSLEKKSEDFKNNQLVYLITEATGYFSERKGQYLTVYVKDISQDDSQATFAIATKDGVNSIANSKGDVIGKTLEEAQAIKAPEADKVWEENMMSYAHVWMQTTKK